GAGRRAGRRGRVAGRLVARPPRRAHRRAGLVADEPGLARVRRSGGGRGLVAQGPDPARLSALRTYFAVIRPCRYGLGLRASHSSKANPSSSCHEVNAALAGSSTGSLNRTSSSNASGSLPSNAARLCALVHMPCAIALGKPSSLAVTGYRWIGLLSPETAA